MIYEATWREASGRVSISEDGKTIHEGHASEIPTAGEWVRDQGFWFTDLWTKVPDVSEWKARLKAV